MILQRKHPMRSSVSFTQFTAENTSCEFVQSFQILSFYSESECFCFRNKIKKWKKKRVALPACVRSIHLLQVFQEMSLTAAREITSILQTLSFSSAPASSLKADSGSFVKLFSMQRLKKASTPKSMIVAFINGFGAGFGFKIKCLQLWRNVTGSTIHFIGPFSLQMLHNTIKESQCGGDHILHIRGWKAWGCDPELCKSTLCPTNSINILLCSKTLKILMTLFSALSFICHVIELCGDDFPDKLFPNLDLGSFWAEYIFTGLLADQ